MIEGQERGRYLEGSTILQPSFMTIPQNNNINPGQPLRNPEQLYETHSAILLHFGNMVCTLHSHFPTSLLLLTDHQMDRWTDRRMDGRTKPLIELRVRN